MIKKKIYSSTSIRCNESLEGETIEQKIARIVNNNEPIKDGAPLIYMERKEGINPDYDVRTDRFDAAIDAMDVIAKSKNAKREQRMNPKKEAETPANIQGTEPPTAA